MKFLNIRDRPLLDLSTNSDGFKLMKSLQVRFINFGKIYPKVISPNLM